MATTNNDQWEVLIFEVSGRRYGLPAAFIRELLRAVTIVPMPGAPAIVEGLINLRGTVLPVLDVRARFRLPAKAPEHTDHLIVAQAKDRLVVLRVDRAVRLVQLQAHEVEDARVAVPEAQYVAGVAKLPDGLVLIFDLHTFLTQGEATELAGALDDYALA